MPFFRPTDARFQKYSTTVSVGFRLRAQRHKQSRMLECRLGDEIVRQLGWEKGTCIEVLWGDGAEFGQVRLAPGEVGVLLRTNTNSSRSFKVASSSVAYGEIADDSGNTWRFDAVTHPMTEVGHRIESGHLIVDLPREWFKQAGSPPGDGNGKNLVKQKTGRWEDVDREPQWSHEELKRYDAQRERRLQNLSQEERKQYDAQRERRLQNP